MIPDVALDGHHVYDDIHQDHHHHIANDRRLDQASRADGHNRKHLDHDRVFPAVPGALDRRIVAAIGRIVDDQQRRPVQDLVRSDPNIRQAVVGADVPVCLQELDIAVLLVDDEGYASKPAIFILNGSIVSLDIAVDHLVKHGFGNHAHIDQAVCNSSKGQVILSRLVLDDGILRGILRVCKQGSAV